MNRFWLIVPALCGLLAGFHENGACAADNATGAKLVPRETLAFISIPSVVELKQGFEKSVIGSMFQDPELKPFLEDVWKKIDELSEKAQQEIGVSIHDLLASPHGEMTFAVVERPENKLGMVLLIDYGENKTTVETLLKKLHDGLEGNIAVHSTQEVSDVTIHSYEFSDPDLEPLKTLTYFNEGSYLVFASDVGALKEVLHRWKGDVDTSLANNEVYAYIQDRCKDEAGEPAVIFFIDPIGLFRAAMKLEGAELPQAGLVENFLPTLGVDKLTGFGGAGYFGHGDYDQISKIFLYAEQSTGVLSVFQAPATNLAPPKWVAADCPTYFGVNWNIPEAYRAVEGLVDGFYGAGYTARQLDEAAENPPEIHFKKDFLDLLDGKLHVVQGKEDPEAEEEEVPRILTAFELKDVAKMRKTLARIAKAPGAHFETREFNGETVYEFATVSVAISAGQLLITNDTPAIEAILRSDPQPALVDSTDYKRLSRHFPTKVSLVTYSRADGQLDALYDLLNDPDHAEIFEGIDLEKLPPIDSLKKYLRSSGSYAVPDPKGVFFMDFQLREGDK